jgi:hypothetical protein
MVSVRLTTFDLGIGSHQVSNIAKAWPRDEVSSFRRFAATCCHAYDTAGFSRKRNILKSRQKVVRDKHTHGNGA